ncbi:Cell wall-active antibiotics response 4TMS YvqF [Sphingobacterium nematocida]|uniref:Cell wall-active antibiotics response 4TMS YvqF n=1 Tax=Sphingobacterium nematocida TaxID=1513896 RepID=A0A1T5BZB8_9SPHI|nr:LiaF domain-containing protein [Sphingobacterium nematocida]SKB52732.1 Cell wall-active antibiotics response 4TMS YvqF [Sphingobacterium nematocida]
METTDNMQQKPVLPPNNNKSSTTVGAIIILFGLFLLLKNLDFGYLFPRWIFGWQMILIIIGLVIGVNSKFQKKSSLILITIGGVFLLREMLDFNPGKILIPAVAIILGIYIINRNRKVPEIPVTPPENTPQHPTDEFDWDKRVIDVTDQQSSYEAPRANKQNFNEENTYNDQRAPKGNAFYYAENYLKIDSIFGSAKKIVLSKNFLGGTMTNIFGSTEVNLLQADLNQPAVIDIFQLFGSTKIIVPPHWTVSPSVSSIMGESDDRRVIINHPFDENKKLFITGTSIFGSLTIKNS